MRLNGGYQQAVGPSSIAAAESVRREIARRDQWPYPHVYPPNNSIRRNPTGYVVCPAPAASANILTFTVPQGFWFYMQQLGLYVLNTTFNAGDFLFSVTKNVPLGITTFQGVPLTDLQNIAYNFGSPDHGPVQLPRAELFAPSDVIRANVQNINLGGPPITFAAVFGGYLLPTVDAPNAE
jgi:hypothetical protein